MEKGITYLFILFFFFTIIPSITTCLSLTALQLFTCHQSFRSSRTEQYNMSIEKVIDTCLVLGCHKENCLSSSSYFLLQFISMDIMEQKYSVLSSYVQDILNYSNSYITLSVCKHKLQGNMTQHSSHKPTD